MKKNHLEHPLHRDYWQAGVHHSCKKTFPVEFLENGHLSNPVSRLLKSATSFCKQMISLVPSSFNKRNTNVSVSGFSNSLPGEQPHLAPPGIKRRLAGILYADIAGYSRLTEQDEDGTHDRFLACMMFMQTPVAAS